MLNLQYADSSSGGKFSFQEEPLYPYSTADSRDRGMVTYTYEDHKLYEDGKPVKATIHCSEMTPEMESWAIDCAAIALLNKASIKHAASYIKKEFDKEFGPSWQCVVGNNFGRRRSTMAERKAVVKNADMTEDMQSDAVSIAGQALEKFNIEKDIAAYIKKEFDKKHSPTWHCIVGRNFGSYVTHETNHFIYFYLGQVAILLFKSG
ncbi:unnamed protein product [Rodentolepis nana]|uniref:Dynein light chain n=1 Tax=Rodentolepis nana TaxID=102285 RepID=A0A158QII1_RODNA|nr:unnamed protein product [Rodentolepis nana]